MASKSQKVMNLISVWFLLIYPLSSQSLINFHAGAKVMMSNNFSHLNTTSLTLVTSVLFLQLLVRGLSPPRILGVLGLKVVEFPIAIPKNIFWSYLFA